MKKKIRAFWFVNLFQGRSLVRHYNSSIFGCAVFLLLFAGMIGISFPARAATIEEGFTSITEILKEMLREIEFLLKSRSQANVSSSFGITGEIAYWAFDEGTGTSGADSSGNGNTMSLLNGATWTTGKFGNGLSLDGINDYASAPHSAILSRTNGDASVCFWLKRTGTPASNSGLVGKSYSGGISYGLYFDTTSKVLPILKNATDGSRSYDSSASAPLNSWSHFCGTFDDSGTSVTARVYQDGVLKTTIQNTIRIGDGGEPFWIGRRSGYYTQAVFDEVRVFDKVLSASEVSSIYSHVSTGSGGGTTPPDSGGGSGDAVTPPPVLPTDTSAPVRSDGSPSGTFNVNSVTMSLSTNENATCKYGTVAVASYDELPSTFATTGGTSHSQSLSLSDGNYTFHVRCKDDTGNANTYDYDISFSILTPSPIVVTPPPVTSGNQFFAAPNGTSSGDGSITKPWNLSTALSHPSAVKPGDTIYLRGGTYNGAFTSRIAGTASQPITIRQYPGERAIIDGKGTNDNPLYITGSYGIYWGFEVTNTDVNRPEVKGSRPAGLNIRGPNNKFINLIVHDNGQGFGFWIEAPDSEIYGAISYFNGNSRLDHGIYIINKTGTKKVTDSIVFNNHGHGLHGYGESTQGLNDITYEGNISFRNGDLRRTGTAERNFLLGGWGIVAANPVIRNNYGYYPTTGGENLNVGYGGGCSNAQIVGNYMVGGSGIIEKCTISQFKDNYLALGSLTGTNFSSASYSSLNTFVFGSPLKKPATNKVVVRPNAYEAGRANIAIFNWENKPEVSVDISSVGLSIGDTYELRNVQDYHRDIILGTFNGGPINIPMTGRTVGSPYGFSSPASSFPEFGAFVLIRKQAVSGGGGPQVEIPTDSDGDGVVDSNDLCAGTPSTLLNYVNTRGCPIPKADNFVLKPDWSAMDLRSAANVEIGTSFGKIRFQSNVVLLKSYTAYQDRLDIDGNVAIGLRTISINVTNLPELNVPAILTFYNIQYSSPKIMKDGQNCSSCSLVSKDGTTVVYSVPGFSTYEVVEGASAPVPSGDPSSPGGGSVSASPSGGGGSTPPASSGGGGGGSESTAGADAPSNNSENDAPSAGAPAGSGGGLGVNPSYGNTLGTFPFATSTAPSSKGECRTEEFSFNRTLNPGSSGEDVRRMQQFLNQNGFIIASSGPGSPGSETDYFGQLTKAAVARFQAAYIKEVLAPAGLSSPSGIFGPLSRAKAKSISSASSKCADSPPQSPKLPTAPVSPTTPKLSPKPVTVSFKDMRFDRNLREGSSGEDVMWLQMFLNGQGYRIANSGVGSPGQETVYFGEKTKLALQKFQCAKKLRCSGDSYGSLDEKTRIFIHWLLR